MLVEDVKRKSLGRGINTHVEPGTMVYTGALRSYNDLNYDYIHNVINQAEKYVDGNVQQPIGKDLPLSPDIVRECGHEKA